MSRRRRVRTAIAVATTGLLAGGTMLITLDAAHAAPVRYEAEDSSVSCDGDVESEHAGFSGSGYCNTENSSGVTTQFTVGGGGAGTATLGIRYANGGSSSRPADVVVNGTTMQSTSFDATGGWTNWATQTVTVPVNAGGNTIGFTATGSDGLPNIDYLDFESDGTPDDEAPSAPSNLQVADVSSTSVDLTWGAASDNIAVAGYEIFQAGSSDMLVGTAQGTTFTVTGLSPETSYQFYAVAFDGSGNRSGPSNTVSVTTEPGADPGDALFVSPDGSDDASGTESDPTTLTSAITRVQPGGTIFMRGGTYNFSDTVHIEPGNDGTSGNRKNLFAYQGETPVLNFSAQSENSANRGLAIGGDWWHVYGIIVERAGDNGILLGGNDNIIERTVTRFNRDTGLQLSRYTAGAPRETWPSNNLIQSAVSHDNVDSDGEDADGFAPKLTVGPGNVFRYTVAHNNIDDGYDLYTKDDTGPIGEVRIEHSLAYDNGTLSDGSQAGNGDRNGFKLGGEDIGVDHVIVGNVSYENGKHGFTYNRNLGSMTVSDNVSIGNEERNFNFDGGSSRFQNNTSCDSGSNDRIIGNDQGGNQWWEGSNGSRCSSYSGGLDWYFESDGRLVVTFGGNPVMS